MPRPKSIIKAARQFQAPKGKTGSSRFTYQAGQVGFDNPRENIDHHIKTKAVDTKTISAASISILNAPTDDLHATNKQYVDSQISGENHWDQAGALPDLYVETHVDGSTISGSKLAISGSDLFVKDGKVGIGTKAPTNALTFASGHWIDKNGQFYARTLGVGDVIPNGSAAEVYIEPRSSFNALRINDGSGNGKILVDNSGNMSIGGITPVNTLSVNGSISGTNLYSTGNVGVGTSSPGSKLDIVSSGTGSWVLRANAYDGSTLGGIYEGSSGHSDFYLYNAAGVITTRITSTGNAYFNNSGNTGVGTTAPTTKLQISGGTLSINDYSTELTTINHAGQLVVSGGALLYLGTSGTLTTIAAA